MDGDVGYEAGSSAALRDVDAGDDAGEVGGVGGVGDEMMLNSQVEAA